MQSKNTASGTDASPKSDLANPHDCLDWCVNVESSGRLLSIAWLIAFFLVAAVESQFYTCLHIAFNHQSIDAHSVASCLVLLGNPVMFYNNEDHV